MTANKHLKHVVRARMAETGEPYSAARDRMLAAQTDLTLTDPVVLDVHGRHGQAVAFTPDGTSVLSGGQDARIAIANAAAGSVEGDLVGHDKVVNAVAVARDATTVVSASSDRTVRVWDLPVRSQVAELRGHRDAVVALDLAPHGRRAITGGYDGQVRVWDLDRSSAFHCMRE